MTDPTTRQFYAVNLKPFSNGTTRWLVYELVMKDGKPALDKLWPVNPHDHKQSQKNGFTYSKNTKYPAYHFQINEIGTSHTPLLQGAIAYALHKDQGEPLINANRIKLEILG